MLLQTDTEKFRLMMYDFKHNNLMLDEALRKYYKENQIYIPDIPDIVKKVLDYYYISKDEWYKTRAKKPVIIFKCLCMILREKTNLSWTDIGKIRNRDHATAYYGCESFKSDLELGYKDSVEIYHEVKKIIYDYYE